MRDINKKMIDNYMDINNNLCGEYTGQILGFALANRRFSMQKNIYYTMFQVACNQTFHNYKFQFIRYSDITNY